MANIGEDSTMAMRSAMTKSPLLARPGRPLRYDYEYERNGVANILMMFESI
jgi:hypothetical protein